MVGTKNEGGGHHASFVCDFFVKARKGWLFQYVTTNFVYSFQCPCGSPLRLVIGLCSQFLSALHRFTNFSSLHKPSQLAHILCKACRLIHRIERDPSEREKKKTCLSCSLVVCWLGLFRFRVEVALEKPLPCASTSAIFPPPFIPLSDSKTFPTNSAQPTMRPCS